MPRPIAWAPCTSADRPPGDRYELPAVLPSRYLDQDSTLVVSKSEMRKVKSEMTDIENIRPAGVMCEGGGME